jgi:hypothetical protein
MPCLDPSVRLRDLRASVLQLVQADRAARPGEPHPVDFVRKRGDRGHEPAVIEKSSESYAVTVHVTVSVCCIGPLVAMIVRVNVPRGDAAAS